ncbi:chymotrypsin inhibitor [Cephus cinctus]|uniref:Chymotrypsin inhibitor n=1 Tax=Cephus cinctus TaxID=211228 RepID=A0AAJ7BXM4_CEPCN|nr:chymotrypsin inhibitor [Cephus cinctus]
MNKFLVFLLVVCMAAFSNQQDDECGPNAVYNRCGSACYVTCNSPRRPRLCPTVCVEGCFCKRGYVFISTQDRRCVLQRDCPK